MRENRDSVCDASVDDMQHLTPYDKEQGIGSHPEGLAEAAARRVTVNGKRLLRPRRHRGAITRRFRSVRPFTIAASSIAARNRADVRIRRKHKWKAFCLDNLLCAHQREVNVVLMAQISEKAAEADGLGESDQAKLGLTLARLALEERRCLGKGNRIARFQLLAPPRLARVEERRKDWEQG
ncbi:uncharacterized protein Triagg1_1823 [Trichoderma aggressivum f. europaeum]|uniref:Uncharacterized protein n=1 Tax=Trichoderma aggressivum f. europaeum TaxID=173218 RepID=A0AAE1M2Q5_9HYPO|nr:hypothetical protein Triagg1_1823 [Trichoderma aggressivum f. europaeum]